MFLSDTTSGHLVEVLDLTELINPRHASMMGRYHYGEEAQDAEIFEKRQLRFPSGEALPRCWTDAHYRDHELPGG
ncbi:hypothetical protein A11A3_09847 [Alcanivorax hongdengensis A-11-3]|uniref:Acetyltransferase n=1 Tax=Alcanivorax hongdengensis A-11-3 TaxID=1177179 RepID=L0WDA7_9GAMM|nr:hypothetical protein [Alcanivorax hongdengensis]EKF74112.1 hypothetical protein A11A3_09847 [Alcanivorax hongdengensis A-11-3]